LLQPRLILFDPLLIKLACAGHGLHNNVTSLPEPGMIAASSPLPVLINEAALHEVENGLGTDLGNFILAISSDQM
jgi:hypothetical protein